MENCEIVSDSFPRRHSESVIKEARERITKLEDDASRNFWYHHPDVQYQLKTIPTLRDLDVPLHIPKTVFLTRLLFPISPSNKLLPQLVDSVLTEIESLRGEALLMPNEPRATRIVQSLRASLQLPKTREHFIGVLEKDERSVTNFENDGSDDLSLRNFFVRCTTYPMEIPAKEEVLYLIASLAMHFPEASSESVNIYLASVLNIFRDSFHGIDEHIITRRKAKEQHELSLMTARFQVNKVARFLPPVFSYKRYRHKGSFAGHRMRSLSLFTAAIIMHFWKRTSTVSTLISHCCESQQVSRLHLLKLLQIVIDNWSITGGRKLFEKVNHQMRELLKVREECTEQGEKKAVEVINECSKRLRFIRKMGGSTILFSNTVTATDKKKVKAKNV